MRNGFEIDPRTDLVLERFIDAPAPLVWEALTTPEHVREWYMPREWGRVAACEMELRPGGAFRIDIAVGDGEAFPNLGCFLEVVPLERLVWTSMLFPGFRPAVFDDIPITAVVTLASEGTGTRYVFTALHRSEADLEANRSSGWQQGTEIALDQLAARATSLRGAHAPRGGASTPRCRWRSRPAPPAARPSARRSFRPRRRGRSCSGGVAVG